MKSRGLLACVLLLMILAPAPALAQGVPGITVQLSPDAGSPAGTSEVSLNLQLLLLFAVLALGPALVVMMTSFTRMVVVLSFVRHAIGTQQMPPAQLILGLALILTGFVMAPVFQQVHSDAIALLFLPWIINKLVTYTTELFNSIPMINS